MRKVKVLELVSAAGMTGDVIVVSSAGGVTIRIESGELAAEVDLSPERSIQHAASVVNAVLPLFMKRGISSDRVGEMFVEQLQKTARQGFVEGSG